MKYRVKFFAYIREITGEKEITVRAEKPMSVSELLSYLSDKYGKKFREVFDKDDFNDIFMIVVNNKLIVKMPNKEDIELEDGSEVAILPPVGGG